MKNLLLVVLHFSPRAGFGLALSLLLFAIRSGGIACSECGCSLCSDWAAQGMRMMPGLSTSARFEYYDATDLRSGLHSISRTALSFPSPEEIQQETLNHNLWADLDYVITSSWAVSAQVPYYDRFHSTIAAGDTAVSESRARGLGDLRLLVRYQVFEFVRGFSVQWGLKLPTGKFEQNFATGPQVGAPLDRGLQLGSGTTDLLAGLTYYGRRGEHWGYFLQTNLQDPLARRAEYLPATTLGANGGLRYLNASRWTPQLQVNLRWDGREHGAAADRPNSGDTLAYLSPGLTVETGNQSSAFAFVQLPFYQRVNGRQIEPRWLLSTGWRTAF